MFDQEREQRQLNPEHNEDSFGIFMAGILIHAITWLVVIIILNALLSSGSTDNGRFFTVMLLVFVLSDILFRAGCAWIAQKHSIIVTSVRDVLSNSYFRYLPVYPRVMCSYILFGILFLIGIITIVLSLQVLSSSLLQWGVTISFLSFIRILPIHPSEGSDTVLELLREKDSSYRVIFEATGFFLLAAIFSLISPFFALLFFIPLVLTIYRFDERCQFYDIVKQVESKMETDDSLRNDTFLNPRALEQYVDSLDSLDIILEPHAEEKRVEERTLLVARIIDKVRLRPMTQPERTSISVLMILILFVQFFSMFIVINQIGRKAEPVVTHALESGNCEDARQGLLYFESFLKASNDYQSLSLLVKHCGEKGRSRKRRPQEDITPRQKKKPMIMASLG